MWGLYGFSVDRSWGAKLVPQHEIPLSIGIYPAAPQLHPYGEGGVGDLNYVVNQAQLISLILAALGLVSYPCSWPAKLLDAIKAQLPLHRQ